MKIIKCNQKCFQSTSFPLLWSGPWSALAKKAGLTSTVSFLEISTPLKYWVLSPGFTPIYTENWPIGSLPKSISIEKMKEVVGIYLAVIDVAPLNPLTI